MIYNMLKFFKVRGRSMSPELQDGDVVLALIWRRLWRLKPGDRIIFHQPAYGMLIKSIERLGPGPDQVFVTGRAAASVDSYEFGPVPLSNILGIVVLIFSQKK
jgi:signal peptidase I